MARTQILLPDELYQRAKRLAEERGISLGEMTRRGLELFLASFPETLVSKGGWSLPEVRGGGITVPLEKLRNIAAEDEEARRLRP
jgi:hypothetical protein